MVAFKDTKKVVFKDVNKRYIFTDPAVPSVKDGVDGRDGKDGMVGPQGPAGRDGRDGSGINWLGEYNPGAQYQPNDSVFYLGSSYICIKPTRDNPPNQSKTYWNLLASAGAGGANGRNAGATDIPPIFNTLGMAGVFIGPTEPVTELKEYIWVQTGLGTDGNSHTMWFRTCGDT